MNPKYSIQIYAKNNGREPFSEWVSGLDASIRGRIFARLDRVEQGNLGDWKPISENLCELRFNFGAGYRIYFGRDKDTIIVLFSGGDKKTQRKDIEKAKSLWSEYERRKENEIV